MSSWTSTHLITRGDVVNYLQPGVHLCCVHVCVSQSEATAGGWIIRVYRLEQQRWGAEGGGGGAERGREVVWTSLDNDSPLSQIGGERTEDASRNCRLDWNLFLSQLTSNLLNEAVTIFGHEVLSWLSVHLLLHSEWWCFWVIAKKSMLWPQVFPIRHWPLLFQHYFCISGVFLKFCGHFQASELPVVQNPGVSSRCPTDNHAGFL